jgi:prevent-host-death family protein
MLDLENFKTITQLRHNTLEVIKSVQKKKKIIYIIAHSKPQAILIDLEEYGNLLNLKRENEKLRELVNGDSKSKS